MSLLGDLADKHSNTRFLMIVSGVRIWMSFRDCYITLDRAWDFVDGYLAIDVNGSGVERFLTEEEKRDINRASDEWSGMA